jgi:hypothetical protein
LLWLFTISTITCSAEGYSKAPAPQWVQQVALPDMSEFPVNQVQNGVYYLLIDNQVKVDEGLDPKYYYHYAYYIINQAGVETASQINIGYYSEYNKLTIHGVRVIRNGKMIDKMDSARMNIIQREEEMDDLIYNGKKTLNIILDDIREGDVIEYSYSRDGMNPVYNNMFSYNRYLNWAVPVGRFALRLLWNKPRELHYMVENSKLGVTKNSTDDGSEFIIRSDDVEVVKSDKDTPSWYMPWGMVRFSEFESWDDVVRWSMPYYTEAIISNGSIDALTAKIRNTYKDKKQQISSALRFVQDEIRYLGIELGQNTHKPTRAFETLQNRYGDCKDKSVLFVTLLKGLGVEAYPVLVNTEGKLTNVLPSAGAFDHVISYFELDGKRYWVDPTRQYQYGGIDSIHQPDYGNALVLRPGTNSLTEMSPRQSEYGVFVHDRFALHADKTVDFMTTTESRGWNAERARGMLADSGKDKMQSEYLKYFQRYYPGIKVAIPFTYTDDVKGNRYTTTEHYNIGDFWQDNQERHRYYATFYPNIVSAALQVRDEPSRTDPLYLTYPERLEQEIEIKFEDRDWYFEDENFTEDNEFFHFQHTAKFDEKSRILLLSYTYQSKQDSVPADSYLDYLAALKRVGDYRKYGIYMSYPVSPKPQNQPPWYMEYITVTTVLGAWFGVYLLVFVLWRIDRHRNPDSGEAKYYPVAMPKLVAMWLLTFGLYGVYWYYRNFKYIKQQEHDSSMPVARAIFNIFWYYPLWKILKDNNDSRYERLHLPGKPLAVILALLFFIAGLAENNAMAVVPSMLISALLVVPLANYILFVNGADSLETAKNSRWRFRHYLLALASTPLLVLTLGSGYGIIPSESVVRGSWLLDHNIQVMQRNGIIKTNDRIDYFYSDAFLFVSDDGNGFTQRHVFSYWKDDDGKLQSAQADYTDIKDIKVDWQNGYAENSTVTIVRNDGSEFILYVSNSDRKDRVFVSELRRRWEGAK